MIFKSLSRKEQILKMSFYIRHKIRDIKNNIEIISALESSNYFKASNSLYVRSVARLSWSQNWTLLIINICTIFEKNDSNDQVCSLLEIWKLIASYKRLNKEQKRRKSQLLEMRKGFSKGLLKFVKQNNEVRNKCIAHNDYFKKQNYSVSNLEAQKELLEYAESFLSVVGCFISINIYPLSDSHNLRRSLFELQCKQSSPQKRG